MNSVLECHHVLIKEIINCSSHTKEKCVLELVPSLIGLCNGMNQTRDQRHSSLEELFEQEMAMKTGGEDDKGLEKFKCSPQQLQQLLNDVR